MTEKRFKVDAKAVLTLGRNSIKDSTTAVVELIKNAYDADAEVVELSITTNAEGGGTIRISDNGHGMSDEDIENHWLRIGFSEKVANKTSLKFSRRKTGEKGIGRLSADRLGSLLSLKSRRRGQSAVGLKIDWSSFEVPGKEIGQIVVPVLSGQVPKVPTYKNGRKASNGTELVISQLRQEWSVGDIEKIHAELSLLLPPYPEIAKTFAIRFSNDVAPDFNGNIQYGQRIQGEIEFKAKISKRGELEYKMRYFNPTDRSKRVLASRKVPWKELAPDPRRGESRESYKLGETEIRLSYFVRRADLLEAGLRLGTLRQYLEQNVGVKIYRDMVRVKPYGDPAGPEADWLGLGQRKISDPAGARRSSFKIAPNQLVGAVFAGRDTSPALIDSSSREGLIENDAFRQLKVVLMRCINVIESKYHELNKNTPRQEGNATKAKAAVKSLAGSLSNLSEELSDLRSRMSDEVDIDLSAVNEQISLVIERAQAAEKNLDELANQATVYRGLATVGIASAIFGHETATAINVADGKVRVAKRLLTRSNPDVVACLDRLDGAIGAMERIASWGKFALTRVSKDKRRRRKINVSTLVSSVLDELQGPMASADVVLRRQVESDLQAKTFEMDIEAVLINLMTNAYHEVKRHQGDRVIQVKLTSKERSREAGIELVVADNGGGIPPEHTESIWEPLFSTRTDDRGRATGTGLGLAIVRSAMEELGGGVEVKAKGALGGAAFYAWLPRGMK